MAAFFIFPVVPQFLLILLQIFGICFILLNLNRNTK